MQNGDQGRYGNLVFKYREAYAGNEDKYLANVKAMLDIMRSHPKKKRKKKQGEKNDKSIKGSEDSSEESSFAQKNKEYACFCCGDKQCLFCDCPKKATLPKEQWHDPSRYNKSYRQQVNSLQVEEDASPRMYEVLFNHAQCHSKVIAGGTR